MSERELDAEREAQMYQAEQDYMEGVKVDSEIAALRAKLGEVERERDAAQQVVDDADAHMTAKEAELRRAYLLAAENAAALAALRQQVEAVRAALLHQTDFLTRHSQSNLLGQSDYNANLWLQSQLQDVLSRLSSPGPTPQETQEKS